VALKLIPPKWRRGVRFAKYLMLLLAGGIAFATPSAVLTSVIGLMVYAWATFLFVGGALCLLGVVTDWWIGEFVGIIPIFTAMFMFGVVFLSTGLEGGANPSRIVFGLVFFSFAAFLIARWIDVWNVASLGPEARREQ
jgi:hypothetical protein